MAAPAPRRTKFEYSAKKKSALGRCYEEVLYLLYSVDCRLKSEEKENDPRIRHRSHVAVLVCDVLAVGIEF
jgi:hypothetical protein